MHIPTFTGKQGRIVLGKFDTEQDAQRCLRQLRDEGVQLRDQQVTYETDPSPTARAHTQAIDADPTGTWSKNGSGVTEHEATTTGSGGRQAL